IDELERELEQINQELWDIEDRIRDCERRADFGPEFIELPRAVYKTNDRRAAVKRRINDLAGSALTEEKSYHPRKEADAIATSDRTQPTTAEASRQRALTLRPGDGEAIKKRNNAQQPLPVATMNASSLISRWSAELLPAYLINLDRSTDRLTAFHQQNAHMS